MKSAKTPKPSTSTPAAVERSAVKKWEAARAVTARNPRNKKAADALLSAYLEMSAAGKAADAARAIEQQKADPYRIAVPQDAFGFSGARPARRASFETVIAGSVGQSVIAAIGLDRGITAAAIRDLLDYFDKVGGFHGVAKQIWEKGGRGGEDAQGRRMQPIGSEVIDAGGVPDWSLRVPKILKEQIEEALEYAAQRKAAEQWQAKAAAEDAAWRESKALPPKDMPAKAPKKAPSMSPDAIRKRAARAAGKVKPRASRAKPPRTLAQNVASRRLAVETREAKLAKLRDAHSERPQAVHVEILKTEKSLQSARKALQTAERQLAEASPNPS